MTSPTRSPIALAATIAVLALAALPYVQTIPFGFTLDDANTIVGHRGVKEALSWDDLMLRDYWGRSQFDTVGVWRPMVTLTFWCDQHVGGGRAWVFHATNLALYVALVLLANAFLARWTAQALSPSGRWFALAAFGAFAIHADVVPSATGRAEILAAIFSLGAIMAATCAKRLGAREIALSSLAMLLALLSKESSAPILVLVPLLAWRARAEPTRERRSAVLALAAWGALLGAAIATFRKLRMPLVELGPERLLDNPLILADFAHRLVPASGLLTFRLRHLLLGTGLLPDYSFSVRPTMDEGAAGIALGVAFTVACVALVAVCWKRAPRIADAMMALGASYASMSNVLVAAPGIGDRHFFFPSFWLAVVVALVVDRLARTFRARCVSAALAASFIFLQAWRATSYAAAWRDDVTLLSAAVRANPSVFRTQRNLAHAFADGARHDDAAFHLAIAEVIVARFPTPVARDAISPAWDDGPLPARLAHLREAFGATATCAAALVASKRVRSWGDAPAGDALDAWVRAACPP